MENVPPTPSPPPRLRRSPKRRALHERSKSLQNANPFESDAREPDRTGGDDTHGLRRHDGIASGKIHAPSPFPTSDAQRLPPPTQRRSRGRPPTARSILEILEGPRAGVRVSRSSNTQDASGPSPQVQRRPVNAPAPDAELDDVQLPPPSTPANGRRAGPGRPTSSDIINLAHQAEFDSHPTSTSPHSAASLSSSPPWRVIASSDDSWTLPERFDVEHRSSMDGYPRDEEENLVSGHDPPPIHVSSPAEEDSEAYQHASSPPSLPPARVPGAQTQRPFPHSRYQTPTALAASGRRASLGAIASIAAGPVDRVSRENTPMTGDSAGSSGTVRRQRHFAGAVPEGYFSLYPPSTGRRRSHTPPGRLERSSSDPPRPRHGGTDVSPASSGASSSPTSPVSPLEEGGLRAQSFYLDPTRTVSDTALHRQAGDVRLPNEALDSEEGASGAALTDESPLRGARQSAPTTLFNRIAAQASHISEQSLLQTRPLTMPRTTAPRVVSVMSTIQSEATEELREDRSSGTPSFVHQESADDSSQGPEFWGMAEQFPHTPRSPLSPGAPFTLAVEEAEEEEEEQEEQDNTVIAQPELEQEEEHEPETRRRPSRGGSTSIFDKALPPLPEMVTPEPRSGSPERHSSPPTTFTPSRDPFRFEPARTSVPSTPRQQNYDQWGRRGSKRGLKDKRDSGNSFRRFRESLPAWARTYYANEARHRATIGAQPLPTTAESPNTRPRTLATQGARQRPESLKLSRSQERALLDEHRARERAYRIVKPKQAMPHSRYSRVARRSSPPALERLTADDSVSRPLRRSGTPPFPEPVRSTTSSVLAEPSDIHESVSGLETPYSARSSVSQSGSEPVLLAAVAYNVGSRRPVSDISDYSRPSSYGEGPSQRPFSDQPSQYSQRRSFERPAPHEPDVQASYSDPYLSEQKRAEAYAVTRERHSSAFAAADAAQRRRSETQEARRRSQRHASHRSDASRRRSDRLRPVSDYSSQRRSRYSGPRTTSDYSSQRPVSDQLTTAGRISATRVSRRGVPGGPAPPPKVLALRASQRSSRHAHAPHTFLAEEGEEVLSPARPSYADTAYMAPQPRMPTNLDDEWSPHLWHDRRSTMLRRRTYIEPSIDEAAEGVRASRRNLQIWLFALGFVLPFAWFVAAFLPLPHPPRTPPASPSYARDLEKQLAPDELARYENARWWRNLNRFMVPVGIAIIVAIVVLVVVAAKQG